MKQLIVGLMVGMAIGGTVVQAQWYAGPSPDADRNFLMEQQAEQERHDRAERYYDPCD